MSKLEIGKRTPELHYGVEGSTLELLQQVIAAFPEHSPTLDDLLIYLRTVPQDLKYLALHNPVAYYEYHHGLTVSASQGGDWWLQPKPKDLVFLLITAPHKGRQLATLVSPEYHDHEFDAFTIQRGFMSTNEGVRFVLMHGLGHTDAATTAAKAHRLDQMGSRSPFYPKIGNVYVKPLSEKTSSELTLEYFLPIKDPLYQHQSNGYQGPSTMRSAAWGKVGCFLFALPGITCDYRRQERNIQKEVTPFTQDEIRETLKHLEEQNQRLNLHLSNPHYYLGRASLPLYQAISNTKEELARNHYLIRLLNKALINPDFFVTPADLGIHYYD